MAVGLGAHAPGALRARRRPRRRAPGGGVPDRVLGRALLRRLGGGPHAAAHHHARLGGGGAAGSRRVARSGHGAAADIAWRGRVAPLRRGGYFVKSARNPAVDASLVWLATPLELVGDDDPVFARTLAVIERDLWRPDGLLRYRTDTFYGGGAWTLLTAGLAWHHARAGRRARAAELLAVVERHRGADGGLPEQVPTEGTDAWFLEYWTRRWGPSASPLLWSHAMVLSARAALR